MSRIPSGSKFGTWLRFLTSQNATHPACQLSGCPPPAPHADCALPLTASDTFTRTTLFLALFPSFIIYLYLCPVDLANLFEQELWSFNTWYSYAKHSCRTTGCLTKLRTGVPVYAIHHFNSIRYYGTFCHSFVEWTQASKGALKRWLPLLMRLSTNGRATVAACAYRQGSLRRTSSRGKAGH
jgi:hypothetical protein